LETLSIVIPVFNEANTIKEIIEQVRGVHLPQIASREIVIVDDDSTDGTRELLAAYKDQNAYKIVFHDRNRGKGGPQDRDCGDHGKHRHHPGCRLGVRPAGVLQAPGADTGGKADVVYGSRFAGGESKRVLYFWHSVGNRFLTTLSNMFTNINLTDMEPVTSVPGGGDPEHTDRGGPVRFEPEVTSKVARMGCRIFEVGIGYSGEPTPRGRRSTGRTASGLSGASSSTAEEGFECFETRHQVAYGYLRLKGVPFALFTSLTLYIVLFGVVVPDLSS